MLLGNPDLDSETVQSIELIWVGQWIDTGISLGYFESHFKGAIVEAVGSGTRIFENEDQDPSKGIELELAHQLSDAWLMRGTYTNILEKPSLWFHESDQLASVMVNYQQGNWNANLFATYHGHQATPALDSDGKPINLNGYWLLFGKLQYEPAAQWQAFIQVKNLLDKDYFTPATNTNLTEGVPNRGREILTGINWYF